MFLFQLFVLSSRKPLYMTDFEIQPPDLANIAIAQNKVLITITFTAKEA